MKITFLPFSRSVKWLYPAKCYTIALFFFGCENTDQYTWKTVEVTATAYNSIRYQTSSDPHITAWGDSLKPGMKCIAVSRDLIALGLTHNTLVSIQGLDGMFLVKDKMNKRWTRRIDIYMDTDIQKARAWGKKNMEIKYRVKK